MLRPIVLFLFLAISSFCFAQSALEENAKATAVKTKECVQEISALTPIDRPVDVQAFVDQISDPFMLSVDEVRRIEAIGPKTRNLLYWQVAIQTQAAKLTDKIPGRWQYPVNFAKSLDQETNGVGIVELMKYLGPKTPSANFLCGVIERGEELSEREIEFAKEYILLRDAVNKYLAVYKTPEFQATIQARKERLVKEKERLEKEYAETEKQSNLAKIAESARNWSDKSGKFNVTAAYVSYEKGVVTFQKLDGSTSQVNLTVLSEADQAFVRKMIKEAKGK